MAQSTSDNPIELYAVLQRSAWPSRTELDHVVDRLTHGGRQAIDDDIRCLRCYVLRELDGTLGTICVYAARSPEAIRRHAAWIEMPVDEIISVLAQPFHELEVSHAVLPVCCFDP